MIQGVIDSKDQTVTQIMVKTSDITAIDIKKKLSNQMAKRLTSKGYSRIPIYVGERANIVGIMLIKSLIGLDLRQEKTIEQHV